MAETFISKSTNETEDFAEKLAKRLKEGDVVALFGELGAGKTAFVRGLARGLSYTGEVSSPTFALVNEYRGGKVPVFHFDMYRIGSWDDLYSIGFFDYLDSGAALVIEWSENIENALPEDCIRVTLSKTDNDNERIITLSGGDEL